MPSRSVSRSVAAFPTSLASSDAFADVLDLDAVHGGARDDEAGAAPGDGEGVVDPPAEPAVEAPAEAPVDAPVEASPTAGSEDTNGNLAPQTSGDFDVPAPAFGQGEPSVPDELAAPANGVYDQRLALPDDAREALDAAQIAANQRALAGYEDLATPDAARIQSVEPTFSPVFNEAGEQVGEQLTRSVATYGDGSTMTREWTPDPMPSEPHTALAGSPGEPAAITWNHADGTYDRSTLQGGMVWHDQGTTVDGAFRPETLTGFREGAPDTSIHMNAGDPTAVGVALRDGQIETRAFTADDVQRALTGHGSADARDAGRLTNAVYDPERDGGLLQTVADRGSDNVGARYMQRQHDISDPSILTIRANNVNRAAEAVDDARKALGAEGGWFPNQERVKAAQERYVAAQLEHGRAVGEFNEAQNAARLLGKPQTDVPTRIQVETQVPNACPSELSVIGAVVGPKALGTNNQPIVGVSYDLLNPEKGVTHFEGVNRPTYKIEAPIGSVYGVPVTGRVNGSTWVLGTGQATDGEGRVSPSLPNGTTIQSNNGGAVTVGTPNLNGGIALQGVLTEKLPNGCVYTGVRIGGTVTAKTPLGDVTVNGWLQYRAGH